MTTRVVEASPPPSPFRPVKTSVRHDEVSSPSINPVIELRERRRDVHAERGGGGLPTQTHTHTAQTNAASSSAPPPPLPPPYQHTHTHVFLYLLFVSQLSFKCTLAEMSALALAAIIRLATQRTQRRPGPRHRRVTPAESHK